MGGMKSVMAAIAFMIGIPCLLAAGVGVWGALITWGPHVDMSSEARILAAVAGPMGLIFTGLGWSIVSRRDVA
jgi:hypothetical protein